MLSKEQLLERQKGITATDISAILNKNPWVTPLDVYNSKIQPVAEQIQGEGPMHWGQLLEPVIANHYATRFDVTVTPGGTISHSKYDYFKATPDFYVSTKGGEKYLLEVKTTRYESDSWGDENTDNIPEHIRLQCAWQAYITGIHRVDVAVLISGSIFKVYRYHADKNALGELAVAAHKFWNDHVLAGVPPKTQAQKVMELDKSSYIKADDKLRAYINKYAELGRQIKELKDQQTDLKEYVSNCIGDNWGILNDCDKKLAYRTVSKRESLDTKALKEEYPDIYLKFMKVSETAALTIKGEV